MISKISFEPFPPQIYDCDLHLTGTADSLFGLGNVSFAVASGTSSSSLLAVVGSDAPIGLFTSIFSLPGDTVGLTPPPAPIEGVDGAGVWLWGMFSGSGCCEPI